MEMNDFIWIEIREVCDRRLRYAPFLKTFHQNILKIGAPASHIYLDALANQGSLNDLNNNSNDNPNDDRKMEECLNNGACFS
jgi:hypothetical protein